MTTTLVLTIVAAILGLLSFILHIIFIIGGFKTSARDGLVCFLVPLGTLFFAFKKSASKKMATVFLLAVIGFASLTAVISYQNAQAELKSKETTKQGMEEFNAQTKSLEDLDDLQL